MNELKNISKNKIFDNIVENIRLDDADQTTFNLIKKDIRIAKIDSSKNEIVFVADNEFTKSIVIDSFKNPLHEACDRTLNTNYDLILLTKEEYEKGDVLKKKKDTFTTVNPNLDGLKEKFSFSNFVVSKENSLLFKAALAISGGRVSVKQWNPFFIFGSSGLGKTHLLHAIGNKAKEANPRINIKYFEAKDFSKSIHEAFNSKYNVSTQLEKIKESFFAFDMLLVDDIQLIEKMPKTREVFFQIFSYFLNEEKRVIITSDTYIDEFSDFEERIITRLKGGLSYGITPPDIKTSIEILKLKLKSYANVESFPITHEALEFIAVNFSASVRELEGAINRITIWTINIDSENLDDLHEIDLDEVHQIFEGMINTNKKGLNQNKIIKTVAKYYKLKVGDILGTSRTKDIMFARHLSIWFIRNKLELSLTDIGKIFKKDITTIKNSINKVENLKKDDIEVNKVIYEINKELYK